MKSIGGTHFLFGDLATGHFSGHTGSSDTDFKVGIVSRGRTNEQSHRQTVKKIKDIIIDWSWPHNYEGWIKKFSLILIESQF